MTHSALQTRVLNAIKKHGSDVTFPGAISGTYDPATDTWSGGAPGAAVVGKAVQTKDDPERFQALGLVLTNPVTLMIAAKGLGVTPAPGQSMTWAGKTYSIVDVESVGPSGEAIYYSVTGSL